MARCVVLRPELVNIRLEKRRKIVKIKVKNIAKSMKKIKKNKKFLEKGRANSTPANRGYPTTIL